MIKVIDYNLLHPSIPHDASLHDILYTRCSPVDDGLYLELPKEDKAVRKKTRRMNRVSKYAFSSASKILDPFFSSHEQCDPWRFGTIFSTSFASYDNVISHLNKLYSKGIGAVSPIEFTYAVGNALISGITINYQLKGPSGSFPDSDVLSVARHYFRRGSCDYILWGSYNTLIPEVALYHENLFRTLYHNETTEPAEGMTLKQKVVENYSSVILGNESGEGIYLEDVVSHQKEALNGDDGSNSDLYMSRFNVEDIRSIFNDLQENGSDMAEIDGVISASFGHPSYDEKEKQAIDEYLPNAVRVYPHKMLYYGPSGSFAINSVVAFEILKNGAYPAEISRKVKEDRPVKILCLGINEVGNLSGGIWTWKQD